MRYAANRGSPVAHGNLGAGSLTKTIDSFKRHGAELDPAGKAPPQRKSICRSVRSHHQIFRELFWTRRMAYELILTEEEKLAGLPPSAAGAARAAAEAKGIPGWRFTLQGPQLPVGDDLSRRRWGSRTSVAGLHFAGKPQAIMTTAR